MNKAIIMGRLTRDPEVRTTSSQIPVATFTVAVDRRFKGNDGERQADFIPVVAWRTNAEFAGRYLKKGTKIVVVGSIQTRNYDDKDGKKVYVTEIIADEMHFAESKRDDSQETSYKPQAKGYPENKPSGIPADSSSDGFLTLDDDDTALPFDL